MTRLTWGGARRPMAWWVGFIVAIAACSGELASEGEPFDGDPLERVTGGSGGTNSGAGGTGAPGFGGAGGVDDPGPAGTGGSGGVAPGAGGAGGAPVGGTGGAPGGGSGGTPIEPPPGTIPMFVAQGVAGRTVISCDEGRSWVADQSDHGGNYCDSNDCAHHPGAGKGVIWAEGWFFVTFGWGSPGSVRRSRDGVTWESMLDGDYFGGLAYGKGRLVGAHRFGNYSDDLGETWANPEQLIPIRNVRAAAFVPHGTGVFLAAASSSGESEVWHSTDGVSWNAPESQQGPCADEVRSSDRIAYGNGVILTTGEVMCRSTNGGVTWTSTSISGHFGGSTVWTGSEFMTWDRGSVFRSADGSSWTETDLVPDGFEVGPAAISADGTVVTIVGEYDGQRAYYSDDGVQWQSVTGSNFPKGHAMRAIAFGYGEPSDECP